MPDQPSPPEITPEMRASARANPNTWLYVIDPAFDDDADVPPWGVVGAYPVNAAGEIDVRFRHNAEYRPSPSALRMPPPTTELENTLQLVRAGYQDEESLPVAIVRAELLLYAGHPADMAVTGFPSRRGVVMVPACTSVAHVPPGWPGWRRVAGRDLVPQLRGCPLVLNPAGPITAVLPADRLSAELAGRHSR